MLPGCSVGAQCIDPNATLARAIVRYAFDAAVPAR
jgi:hypothetical protein